MYCLPIDDLCSIDKAHQKLVIEAAEDQFVNERTFVLGTFNSRVYTYTWFGKQPVILIDRVGAPQSEMPNILKGNK